MNYVVEARGRQQPNGIQRIRNTTLWRHYQVDSQMSQTIQITQHIFGKRTSATVMLALKLQLEYFLDVMTIVKTLKALQKCMLMEQSSMVEQEHCRMLKSFF